MERVLAKREEIADAARRFAPPKRYWAVVGNGPNRVAAEEVRIKLSELCYKSIAADSTEDKKHIDLSSEPLIIVCAAGLRGSIADDVAKETAIFRAHKATPIVIADEGDQRYSAAATIGVPSVDPALGFVLSAMVGHLFGYEAALAIDGSARPLREMREAIERAVAESRDGDDSARRVEDPGPAIRASVPRRRARSRLRRTSRGVDRGAPCRPPARPDVVQPGRAVRGVVGQGGHARRARRRAGRSR